MQGVTVRIFAVAIVASLAVPAGLLASEQSEPAVTDVSGEPAPATQPADPAAPVEGSVEPATPSGEAAPPDQASQEYDEATGPEQERGVKRAQRRKARAAATRTVRMQNIAFKPRGVRIDRGDTVVWENRDPERHDAIGRGGSFSTPVIGKGETSRQTFNRAGEFRYFCSLHAGMTGTVTVSGSGGSGGGGSGGGSGGSGSGSGGGGSTSGSGSSTGSLGSSSFGSGSSGGFGSTSSSGSGSSTSRSSLPDTGQDLIWLLLTGAALVGFGGGLRLILPAPR